MKKDLIEKVLSEQSTPEEEHLLAQMLQQQEDVSRWLTEDETETYDRIVSLRDNRRRLIRWSAAAIILFAVVAGLVVLWPQTEQNTMNNMAQVNKVSPAPITTTNKIPQTTPAPAATTDSISTTQATKVTESPKILVAKAKKKVTTNTAESLQIYIARLEQELEQVTDSSYTAKAEEIIRADARLQKLVQRIMIGEIEKSNLPTEAMNAEQTMEEQP